MLLATVLLIAGLFCNIAVVQATELRLLGVVTVPVVAFYAVYSFFTLPIFLVAGASAYVSLHIVERRFFFHSYDRLLFAILIGLLTPLLVAVFAPVAGLGTFIDELYFLGSIFPGIAAYNLHTIDAERRTDDLLASLLVLTGIVLLGVVLVHTPAVRVAERFPPVLLRSGSDLATTQGVAVATQTLPPAFGRTRLLPFLVVSMVLSEAVRRRWQLRLGGIITIPLIVSFAFRDVAVLPTFLVAAGFAYAAITAINASTLLYGRVLLAFAVGAGLLLSLPASLLFGIHSGILGVFAGMLAGVSAYNVHKLAPHDRFDAVVLSVGVFGLLFGIASLIATPRPNGLVLEFRVGQALVAVGVMILVALKLYGIEAKRPDSTL